MCQVTKKSCVDSFCSPLCTALAWRCNVEVKAHSALDNAGVSESERSALCAQFVGHACGSVFSCCAADAALADWVEGYATDESSASPLLPIAPCKHDKADAKAAAAACNSCKAALSIKLAANTGESPACRYGSPPMEKKGDKPTAGGGALASLEERCSSLAQKLNAKLASVVKDAGDMLCRCAGCCDPPDGKPTCYFPMTNPLTS